MKFVRIALIFAGLVSTSLLASDSIFQHENYGLDVLYGKKAVESVGQDPLSADVIQIGGSFQPNPWFAMGFGGRFVNYDPVSLGEQIESAKGYDLLADISVLTPKWNWTQQIGALAYAKIGLVLASEYDVKAKAVTESEKLQLASDGSDVLYDIKHKLQGYRTALGAKLLLSNATDSYDLGLMVEAARGEEKWINREYEFNGEEVRLDRDDPKSAYEEILIGINVLK